MRIAKGWRMAGEAIMALIAPRLCLGCYEEYVPKDALCCGRCAADIGHSSPNGYLKTTLNCNALPPWSVYEKDKGLAKLIQALKYQGYYGLGHRMGVAYGEWLMRTLKPEALNFDAIVPVPIHWRRRLHRGFNQCEAIGSGLAYVLKCPMKPRWLRRTRWAKAQVGQSRTERQANKERMRFRVPKPLKIKNKRLLLLDDVYTTGTTMSACAETLLNAGAAHICWAAVAVTQPDTDS